MEIRLKRNVCLHISVKFIFTQRKFDFVLAGKSNASDASDSPSKATSQSETSSSLAALFEPSSGGDSLDGTHLFEHWEDDETETDTYLASLRRMVEGVSITKSHGSTAALNESDAERDAPSVATNESKSTASAHLAAGATLFDDDDTDSQQQQDSFADVHLRRNSESESDLPDESTPFSPPRQTEDAAESKSTSASAYQTRIRTGTIPRQNFTFAKAFMPSGTWTPQSTAESTRRRPHRKETQHSASEDVAAAHAESHSHSSVEPSSSAPSQSATAKKPSAANSSDPDEFDDLPVEGEDVDVVDEAEATAEEDEEEEAFASDTSVPSRADPAATELASAELPPAAELEGERERESSCAPPAAAAPRSAPEAPTPDASASASEPTTLASAQPDETPAKLVPVAPKPAPISSAKFQSTVPYNLRCPLFRIILFAVQYTVHVIYWKY